MTAALPAETAFMPEIAQSDPAREPVTVLVCKSCRLRDMPAEEPRPGAHLLAAVTEAARETDITVQGVGCLGNCRRGISVAMLRPGSWSYLFGELDIDAAADVIVGAELLATSSDAFMPFRARPDSLKKGLIARIPTFDHLKDLP